MLADFGLLQLLDSTLMAETATKADNGSARWSAPEILHDFEDNDVYTKEADIWALGMIYYVSETIFSYSAYSQKIDDE